ncbi:MAG: MBL fold metallo-hydrolase [Ilumatobacter sp.]|uniref:MBL fold metallo-hydrolase n=1 Tax=Ilumatobacter sp. TaxID=1967498 RepID=UPI00391C4F8B
MIPTTALTFVGGAGTVTGSKTLLDTPDGRVLIDCGLFQGKKELRLQNWADFPVPPESIDAVVLTHAHVDHCGYVPRLVRLGFRGPVYCTPGTHRLASIVLPDSGHLHEEEADYANRKGFSKHEPALALYTEHDAVESLAQFRSVDFDTPLEVVPGVTATWRHAGHILGAASIDLHLASSDRHVVFSGDLGRPTHPLLLPPAPIGRADVLVTESTYGDRDHPHVDPDDTIAAAVSEAARRGGVVVIPAFAVDRTEIVLWHLDRLVRSGRVPDVPVFVDSPMASRTLDVYREAARSGSGEIRPEFHGTELFSSLQLRETRSVDASKELNARHGPMIIISASGMATGGRVLHHLAQRIGDDRNAVLLVGFQAPGTRGDSLRQGAREIKLFGQYRRVRARIWSIELSAHADQHELLAWADTAAPPPEVVYVNHGEADRSAALVDAIHARTDTPAVVPAPGERVLIGR